MEDAQARRERLKALKEAAQILQQPEEGQIQSQGQHPRREGDREGEGGEVVNAREGPDEAEADQGDREDQGDRQEAEGGATDEPDPGATVAFRNYIPRDEALGEKKLPPVQVPKLKEPEPAESALLDTDDPITSIAPRKENWDLRRDVEKRLQKLERRTQRAMIQLMQEEEERRRLEEQEQGEGDEEEED